MKIKRRIFWYIFGIGIVIKNWLVLVVWYNYQKLPKMYPSIWSCFSVFLSVFLAKIGQNPLFHTYDHLKTQKAIYLGP